MAYCVLAYGLWPMAYGLWPLAFGLWPLAFGLWPMAFGLWPMAYCVLAYGHRKDIMSAIDELPDIPDPEDGPELICRECGKIFEGGSQCPVCLSIDLEYV